MPRKVTVHLTLLAMLWHAALGCSWHHAHAAAGPWSCVGAVACCGIRETHSETHEHSHDSAHAGEAHEFESDASPFSSQPKAPCQHNRSSCTEGDCTYLRGSDGEAISFAPDLQGQAIGDTSGAPDDELIFDAIPRESEAALTALPYLPRCETKQLWLI